MIDYPGKISCVIFTRGCNFTCPYCHNPGLVKNKSIESNNISDYLLKIDNIIDFLIKRKNFLDAVVISGGEPCLQKALNSFIRKIKKLGYLIKLDTNGSNPEVIESLLCEDLIDYIAMDIKTSLDLYNKYITMDFNITKIQNSIDLIMHSSINYEFRTTCIKPVVDEKSIIKILESIKGAKKYVLQKCVAGKNVLNPEFMKNNAELYEYDQLNNFKKIALNMVETCILRA